jgi:PiT family inorganic phosphate transporter
LECSVLAIALLLIAVVLFFDFINGFNDGANMMVTPVITGALEPRRALLLIAVFEFVGAWFLGTAVAQTLGKGIVNPKNITVVVIFAAVGGSIIWNLGGWYFGMPSSSSHALIGGLLGAVALDSGLKWIHWGKVGQVLAILIITPIAGLVAGRYVTQRILIIFSDFKPSRANRLLKRLQILTSISLALSYGSNDAQKGMGMISLGLLLFYGISPKIMGKIYQPLPQNAFYVPKWVILACSLALALGASFGGWRIMKTLGSKLYRIRPLHGFSAQTCSSIIIHLSSLFGFPVSTTQIASSSILGAGSAQSLGSVRWGVGWQIFLTWIITIPGSAVISALLYTLLKRWL